MDDRPQANKEHLLNVGWRLAVIALALTLAGLMAVRTHYRAHPDEYYHVDAFRFFERHWWPPNLGSDAVIYSPQGWSRVYTGELVYLVFGKISRVVQLLWSPGKWTFLIFRLSNVFLLLMTLMGLFFTPCRWMDLPSLGLIFVTIPQVHYLYAYANSDAFALSISVVLFVLAAVMVDRPVAGWRWSHYILLGILTGLLLTSKKPYLFSLILPYGLIGTRVWQGTRQRDRRLQRCIAKGLLLAGALALVTAAPLQIVYPLTHGAFGDRAQQMREEQADEAFKPSNPTFETYHLASKGEGYWKLLTERSWLELSLKSFYGLFGYMSVRSPGWVYVLAGIVALLAASLTGYRSVLTWIELPETVRVALALSPVVFLLNVGASMVRSLHVGFQPQGRYLFPSLIPVAVMIAGATGAERRRVRWLRAAVCAIMILVCGYVLLTRVLLNPALTRL